VNAALLMVSCCLAQGGEKPPPPPPVTTAPPVVLHSAPAAGCGNCAPGICAGTADPMPEESKSGGLFSKIKNRLGGRKKGGGDCDGCGAPVYVSHAPAPCDSCGSSGKSGGLLSRLKARLGGKKKCAGPYADGCGCDAGCGSGCGIPGGTIVVPTTPVGPGPKEMEKVKDPKSAGTFPYGPLTPVAGPAIPPPLPLATAKSPF
jgi:hypothetical protein